MEIQHDSPKGVCVPGPGRQRDDCSLACLYMSSSSSSSSSSLLTSSLLQALALALLSSSRFCMAAGGLYKATLWCAGFSSLLLFVVVVVVDVVGSMGRLDNCWPLPSIVLGSSTSTLRNSGKAQRIYLCPCRCCVCRCRCLSSSLSWLSWMNDR